jgi:hypothetical protein
MISSAVKRTLPRQPSVGDPAIAQTVAQSFDPDTVATIKHGGGRDVRGPYDDCYAYRFGCLAQLGSLASLRFFARGEKYTRKYFVGRPGKRSG